MPCWPQKHGRSNSIEQMETQPQIQDLLNAIERQHGGKAMFAQSVPVKETHGGLTVWQGVVHVFDLEDNPQASRAYAWSSPIEGSTKRRFFAVLHIPPVTSAVEAVRAAIVAEHKVHEN